MYTRPSLLLPLAWSSLLFSTVSADCLSYGIDFQAGGSYFINTGSTADFTSVTQFTGCQNDTADVGLYNLDNGNMYDCSSIPLQPDSTPETSTCDIMKSDMVTGNWALILLSNNGDDPVPLAAERDFYLDCGPQTTVTVTPSLVFNYTTTPTTSSYTTSVIYNTTTISNSNTITVPAATSFVTITPRPTWSKTLITLTRTLKTWTKTAIIVSSTQTASCTVPARPQQPDPICKIYPKGMRIPKGANIPLKRDTPIDFKAAAMRMRDLRAKRVAALVQRDLVKRTADAPTITVSANYTANYTSTYTAATTTVPEIVLTTITITSTQPPVTIHTGYEVDTITLPTPTKTIVKVTTKYLVKTRTMTAKFTSVTTVTPSASLTACKHSGGHFGRGW